MGIQKFHATGNVPLLRHLCQACLLICVTLIFGDVHAQYLNNLESIDVTQQNSDVILRIKFRDEISKMPASFFIQNPVRIAIEFAETETNVTQIRRPINLGSILSLNRIQTGNSTRVIISLARHLNYETKLEGNLALVTIKSAVEDVRTAATSESTDSIETLRALAQQKKLPAALEIEIGDRYRLGLGVEKNDVEAARWFQFASDQGSDEGQLKLAGMYFYGHGVKLDYAQAEKLTLQSALQGNIRAQKALGQMYIKGNGLQKNTLIGAKWYLRAAEQGDVNAEVIVAQLYSAGTGFAQDDSKAADWYSKAASHGDVKAQAVLAFMYDTGQGVAQNKTKAAQLYQKPAKAGIADAQYRLGLLYAQGVGVPLDYKEAESLWKEAASQGNEKAKAQLEVWYTKNPQESCEKVQTSITTLVDEMLPLKKGLWRLESTFMSGTVIEDSSTRQKCSQTTELCIRKSKQLKGGQFWPTENEVSPEDCKTTINFDTENLRDTKTQCQKFSEVRKISKKINDEKYQAEVRQQIAFLIEPFSIIPPIKTEFTFEANFIGDCTQ